MRITKNILFGLGGAFAASLLLSVISPRTAHAMVAALVQVTNTRTNPVPNQDVDQPARNSFVANCVASYAGGQIACIPTPDPTAPNTRVVIQNVNMSIADDQQTQGPSAAYLDFHSSMGVSSAANNERVVMPFVQQSPVNWVVNQPATVYTDYYSGVSPICGVTVQDPSNLHVLNCTISGYTVSLP